MPSSPHNGYAVLSSVYDKLNKAVDYERWADFIEECFARFSNEKIHSLLDLGCGTGSMSLILARRGYDMTALDISEEMLAVAENRAYNEKIKDILFIKGDMSAFELYGTVDAVICCLDGINHLTRREDVLSCFSLVHNYLNDGGLFVFDLNTPYKFREVYAGHDYILEDDGVMCCWQNFMSRDCMSAEFYLSVFEEKDGVWVRHDGAEHERAYSLRTIKNMLTQCGFSLMNVSADYGFTPTDDKCERWYITARKI